MSDRPSEPSRMPATLIVACVLLGLVAVTAPLWSLRYLMSPAFLGHDPGPDPVVDRSAGLVDALQTPTFGMPLLGLPILGLLTLILLALIALPFVRTRSTVVGCGLVGLAAGFIVLEVLRASWSLLWQARLRDALIEHADGMASPEAIATVDRYTTPLRNTAVLLEVAVLCLLCLIVIVLLLARPTRRFLSHARDDDHRP